MAFNVNQMPTYHTKLNKGDVGRYVLLPGDPFRTDKIAAFLEEPKLIAHNREHKTWTGYLDGEKVSVVSTGMGCPSTAIAVEELIKVGADTLIRVGTAGRVCEKSRDPELEGVIFNSAVRDEGTSVQYIPLNYPAVADREVTNALVSAAHKLELNFAEGIGHSKDSFFGEVDPEGTPAGEFLQMRWRAWQKGNVMASDMESSVLFVIASIKGVRAGSVMSFINKDINNTISVACEAVRSMIRQERENKR